MEEISPKYINNCKKHESVNPTIKRCMIQICVFTRVKYKLTKRAEIKEREKEVPDEY